MISTSYLSVRSMMLASLHSGPTRWKDARGKSALER